MQAHVLHPKSYKKLSTANIGIIFEKQAIQIKRFPPKERFLSHSAIWGDFLPKWGDFSIKKRYLKIQVPKNQDTNLPRFSKLRNGIALMPEPHRLRLAIARDKTKGKCDEIPPLARFDL